MPSLTLRPAARRHGLQRAPAPRSGARTALGSVAAYRVTLRKPLGIVFEERPGGKGGVYVAELVPGGNADASGEVAVGDTLERCTAVVLKDGSKEGQYEQEGYGQRPYTNWERVWFEAGGEDFDTVMAALGSNNERWGFFDIELELERAG